MESLALADERIVFITGDLGFNALENVQAALGPRFINAGVAEQNMVGLAAGMAYRGYRVFCYSIAPFVVYRCLEQFRNDACLHNLPVFLVGNGGGYGYGIMGSTHHAIEDLAVLSPLQNVRCYVPGFAEEVAECLTELSDRAGPAYLRLGLGRTLPPDTQRSGSFRVVKRVPEALGTVVALGPVVHNVLDGLREAGLSDEFNVLTALTFPLELSEETAGLFAEKRPLYVVEEHVGTGGLAQQLSLQLLERGIHPPAFRALSAQGYPDGRYGDQAFHQRQSGLDPAHLARVFSQPVFS